jgi:hypothetical protein
MIQSKLDLTTHTSLSPIRRRFAPGFVNYKKGALDSQPQVIKFTSCLPMVGGSLRVFRLKIKFTNCLPMVGGSLRVFRLPPSLKPFSIQSCRSCYATLHLCQRPFYKIFVKFRNSKTMYLKLF